MSTTTGAATHWTDLAACKGHPRDLWSSERGPGVANHGTEAKQICSQCPALRPCLEEALGRCESSGIWGGAGGAKLRHLRRFYVAGGETWEQAYSRHLDELDGVAVGVVNRNGPNVTHGLEASYAKGCRCAPCTLAVGDERSRRAVPLVVVGDRSDTTAVALGQHGRVPAFLLPARRSA